MNQEKELAMQTGRIERVPRRKIVQIITTNGVEIGTKGFLPVLYGLCNDGTVWACSTDIGGSVNPWKQLPAIPQPE